MDQDVDVNEANPEPAWWQTPRRPRDRRVLTGTAAGVADELGVDPMIVRTALILLTVAGGWGAGLYLALWLWSTINSPSGPWTSRPKGRSPQHRHAAIAAFTLGAMLLVRGLGLGFVDSLVWPSTALALGFLFVWHRTRDDAADLASNLTKGGGRWMGVRILAGLAMAAGGVTALLALNFDFGAARNVALGSLVVLAGLSLILGPWIIRMVNDLTRERRLRIRSEERTEVAAHLHDSVLQTLALIQRNADDEATMVQLARRQERELRDWLYGGGGATDESIRRSMGALAAEVEELHGIPIEVVVVGDLDAADDEPMHALLGATREAMVNASRHSGANKIDLYVEVGDDQVEVFVRDTGCGFDPTAVAGDRRGLADSIRGRMVRAGGSCDVVTGPGEGTEIELRIPLSTDKDS